MFFQKSTLIAAATMLAMSPLAANAHMIMQNPVPYGTPEQRQDKAPLDASGANFPCRNPSYTVNTMNDWPVGSTQLLNVVGTAVHGGGSCQISVTTDKQPTKASKWKVIYSIEGGCPTAVGGNLADGDPNGKFGFPFTIPKELPDGELTMAWTWFNKVGNREMYMFCAPVKVSGGAKDSSAYESLPDMAVANIASEGTCRTTEGSDYTFADPGQYKISSGAGPFKSLCGGQAAIGGDAPVAPSPQKPDTPSQATYNPGIPTSAPAVPQVSALTSTLRTIVTVTAPVGTAPTGSPDNYTAPSAKPTAQPVAPSAPVPSAPASPSPAPGNTTGQACSTEGAIVCRGDSEFGLCNHGTVVFQAVAQGTVCKNGAVAKRDAYMHRNMRTVV